MAEQFIKCSDCEKYSNHNCGYYNLPTNPDTEYGLCFGAKRKVTIEETPVVPVKRRNRRSIKKEAVVLG